MLKLLQETWIQVLRIDKPEEGAGRIGVGDDRASVDLVTVGENDPGGSAILYLHSGKAPADLLPVFGQRSHVNEALTGKRNISAAQARKLGQLFHVAPGLFI